MYDITQVYILSVVDGMVTISLYSGQRALVKGISEYHNKGWEKFPNVVVSGDWLPIEHNSLPTVLDGLGVLVAIYRWRKVSMIEASSAKLREV